ncbi:MAG: hypothetical protein N2312_03060, partial [Dictyoglomaceae bacterium]|nr:hypothetical protein [Dictyoglomaceae bacterium]MCX7942577.1 hypothetical protein [Dictyoglomaceae bacterium]
YDAGNNQLRIFYRELENKIYIYKVFNKHDEYEKYLKFTPYSDTLLNINEFKRCKIKREV